MFQCIIQQRNGWIHAPSQVDVFPGKFIQFINLKKIYKIICVHIYVDEGRDF